MPEYPSFTIVCNHNAVGRILDTIARFDHHQ